MDYIDNFIVLSRGHASAHKTREQALRHASKLECLGYIAKVYQQIVLNVGEAFILIYSTEIVTGG